MPQRQSAVDIQCYHVRNLRALAKLPVSGVAHGNDITQRAVDPFFIAQRWLASANHGNVALTL